MNELAHIFGFILSMASMIVVAVASLAALKWASKIEEEDDE